MDHDSVKVARAPEIDECRATISVNETARILGLGRNGTYEAIKRGEIPSIRIGKRILVSRKALENML
ncbi:MAG: hypothetical protein NVSMB64_01180 [Candidatus Velthaea sp.]